MLLYTNLLLIRWVLNPYDMGNATTFGYNVVQEIHQLGDVDFPPVVEATHAINYDGWLVFETAVKEDAIVSAIRNMDFVREDYKLSV